MLRRQSKGEKLYKKKRGQIIRWTVEINRKKNMFDYLDVCYLTI